MDNDSKGLKSFRSIDKEKNRFRFFSFHDRQPDLFEPYSISVRWGRIGSKGRQKDLCFATEGEREDAIKKLMILRKRHKYF